MRLSVIVVLGLLSINSNITYANKSSSHQLRILSLNAWTMPFVGRETGERTKIIGSNLVGFDFVGLQEIWLEWHRNSILDYVPKYFNKIFQKEPLFSTFLESGLFNLTRYKVKKNVFHRYKTCDGIDCYAAKGVHLLRVELTKNGPEVDFYNTHLQAGGHNQNTRDGQLNELKKFMNQNDVGNPVILMGDLNIDGEGEEYSQITNYFGGFTDFWKKLRPNKPGYTCDSKTNPWIKEEKNRSRLDYILVRDGKSFSWKLNDIQIVFNSPMSSASTNEAMVPSDHYGLRGDLTLVPDQSPNFLATNTKD